MKNKILIIGVLFLLVLNSCCSTESSILVILPNAEYRNNMKVAELKKIGQIQFSQFEGFLFQGYVVLTDQPYMKIYTDSEIESLEKNEIKGFRKKIIKGNNNYKLIEDSLCNIFSVKKKNVIDSKLAIYSNNIGDVFSLYKGLDFLLITISNDNECLYPVK